MTTEPETVIDALRQLITEEMYLLGRELDDSLERSQSERLEEIADSLDVATELLAQHRAVRHHDRHP